MKGGAFPQFTDYGFVALGLPRNRQIPANADPHFFDLGLCGPLRTDLAAKPAYCGLFRTPSLRNVALRGSFFHNGVTTDLNEAIRFYAERDTEPQRWYPAEADGSVNKYDDLPPPYRDNVEVHPPLGQRPGDPPVLNDADVDAIAAFLRTLTDGYRP
jgi:cytochrome c peroxidase